MGSDEKSNVKETMVELPAVNPPLFSWVLPGPPQPVPPGHQPEGPARGILPLAQHPDRHECWVGATTAATLIANSVAPGLLGRYLGAAGFKSQQSADSVEPARPANLWDPADQAADHGVRGVFDGRSHASSPQRWGTSPRRAVVASGASEGAVAGPSWRRRAGSAR